MRKRKPGYSEHQDDQDFFCTAWKDGAIRTFCIPAANRNFRTLGELILIADDVVMIEALPNQMEMIMKKKPQLTAKEIHWKAQCISELKRLLEGIREDRFVVDGFECENATATFGSDVYCTGGKVLTIRYVDRSAVRKAG